MILMEKFYWLVNLLCMQTQKRNRPTLSIAKPENAIKIYNSFIKELQTYINTKIKTGKFGADMKINLLMMAR